jgi:hypothetical protein
VRICLTDHGFDPLPHALVDTMEVPAKNFLVYHDQWPPCIPVTMIALTMKNAFSIGDLLLLVVS